MRPLRSSALAAVLLAPLAPLACGGAAPPAIPPVAVIPVPPAAPEEHSATAAVTPSPSAEAGPLSALPYEPALDVASMDRTADPCTSLYQYACGSWMKSNPIPPDQASWSVYGKMTDENRRFLWGVLEELRQPRADRTPSQQKIGDYFAACMDEATVEARGTEPLQPWLTAIAALASVHDLAPLLARLQVAAGLPGGMLFGVGPQQDADDASKTIAAVGAGGLGLPDRDYYTKTDAKSEALRKQYVAHVAKMLTLLGDQPDDAAREAQAVLKIETELAMASLTRVERRDPHKIFHRMKTPQLGALAPAFDWSAFFSGVGLPGLASLNVSQPAFFRQVGVELAKVPLADWKTYLRWHLVNHAAHTLSSPFVQADFDFYAHTLRGVPALRPRWKRCVGMIDDQLGEALGEEFVRRTFTADTKARAQVMTSEIERAMELDIGRIGWMGPETKKQALVKLHAVMNKIGYPDRFRDYGPVTITPDDLEGDVERAGAFEAKREIEKIGKPVDRSEWDETPPTVDAYYDPQLNNINFPAGVLQPPLFDPKIDIAPSYGDTGSTIGHELTHGFDDEGRQFDAKGNLRDWWTKKDNAAFEAQAGCVVEQYGKYTIVDDIKINSRLTEGEDVADLGGTMLAYVAWKHATENDKLESVDGLTPDQRFFVGMAQWACANERPENMRVRAVTDPHSPPRFRVDGVVVNMPEYQAAFSCKAGAPMVREKRCRVW
jgi:endothelin-converting enzyme/putative endopeptidase